MKKKKAIASCQASKHNKGTKAQNANSPCKVHDDGVILEGVVRSGDDLCELAYDVSAVLLTRRRAGVEHKETGLRLRHLGLEGNAAGSSHTHARSTQWKTSELFPPPSSLAAFPAPPATWPRSCSPPSSPVSAPETAHVAFFFFRRRKRPPSSNLRTSNFKCEIASPHFTFCTPQKTVLYLLEADETSIEATRAPASRRRAPGPVRKWRSAHPFSCLDLAPPPSPSRAPGSRGHFVSNDGRTCRKSRL